MSALDRLDEADHLVSAQDKVVDQHLIVALAQGMVWMERYEQARRRLDELIESVRRAAAPMGLAFALAVRSEVQIWIGQWSAAYAAAEEALHWSVELGQPALDRPWSQQHGPAGRGAGGAGAVPRPPAPDGAGAAGLWCRMDPRPGAGDTRAVRAGRG